VNDGILGSVRRFQLARANRPDILAICCSMVGVESLFELVFNAGPSPLEIERRIAGDIANAHGLPVFRCGERAQPATLPGLSKIGGRSSNSTSACRRS